MDSCKDNEEPYSREDPGPGLQRISIYTFDLEKNFNVWKHWRTNDGRILPNKDSIFELVNNPFDSGSLVLLTTYFDPAFAGKAFGGFGMRAPINPGVTLNDHTYIEFDFYYPRSAVGKYMRFELWSTSSGGEGLQTANGYTGTNRSQIYIRGVDMDDVNHLNPDWIGFYKGDTWYKKTVSVISPVSNGVWEYLNIDIHTETGEKLTGDFLLLGNIKITQKDPNGVPIPNIVNDKHYSQVVPFKEKYNPDNGYFYIGSTGTGPIIPKSIRGCHYQIFVDENNLKPECHVGPPKWLEDEYPNFQFKNLHEGKEWMLPTADYLTLMESGKEHYKIHGHCLAWINQSPVWMRQIIPENITSMEWNQKGSFYSVANNAAEPFQKVKKENARRIYFNHIVYLLRHFMTTDTRYNSSERRGIIPFHSFDVLNVEIHESRHAAIARNKPNEWKTCLKNVSWLMAMTDKESDIRQHYVYLLYKFAHIAIPNKQMAEKYKAGCNDPNIVPEYMKLDNHDTDGSIDTYISSAPPIFAYNEYDIESYSKAVIIYNMIKEVNTAWKTDALYDGRNLIECIGIQGHMIVSPTLILQNDKSLALFASLIDEGLLDRICFSEIDVQQPNTAPGGGAYAPDILNQKQADTIGYQYALFFKLLEKYKKYLDHVIFWGQYGASWMGRYLPFDHEQMASRAYYAIMDPDKYIKGHSYLDEFFEGEYEKVSV